MNLSHVALCLVLARFQREQYSHVHWEQPQRSLMLKLPYLQEIKHYLWVFDVDLCVAGQLQDPVSMEAIRKTLTIMTSMQDLANQLSRYRCTRDHEHEQIAGSVKVDGKHINRSTYTERYPRKFARLLARLMCRVRPAVTPSPTFIEVSQGPEVFAAEHHDAPIAKKPRLNNRTKISRVSEVQDLHWGKRQRCTSKTTTVSPTEQWNQILQQVKGIAPRVGKITITQEDILEKIRALVNDKHVVTAVACKGASRTIAPPEHLIAEEAPWRRSIFTERGTGVLKAEDEWENWTTLAKRQLIRTSHPSHLNLTLFGIDKNETTGPGNRSTDASSSSNSRDVTPAPVDETQPTQVSPPVPEVAQTSVPPSTGSLPEPNNTESGLTKNQNQDLQNQQQTRRLKALPRDEQIALIRAHKNLGHPSPEKLSAILRQQGFRSEVSHAALDFKCSICEAQQQPKLTCPGTLRDEMDFNDRICIDNFEWTNSSGTVFRVCHIVDWATSFQTAAIAPARSSDAIIQCIINMWFTWAGAPGEMIVDAGTEFNSEEFCQFTQQNNIKLSTISQEAQHQNGKAERHGSILKTMLTKFEKDHTINTYAELRSALWWCVQAKNASSLRKGFAPEVLVLGKHTRLPGAVCSDETLPAHLLADSDSAQGIQFRQQLAYRESARKAFAMADNDAALRKAFLRRSRNQTQQYSPGEWVMVWKQGRGTYPSQWIGPMKVVVHENFQTIWTTMGSKLYRNAPEHVRPVTASEAKDITIKPQEPSISQIAQHLPTQNRSGTTHAIDLNLELPTPPQPQQDTLPPEISTSTPSEAQPDTEPIPSTPTEPNITSIPNSVDPQVAVDTPIPPIENDDELTCEGLHCMDIDDDMFAAPEQAWICQVDVTEQDIQSWKEEPSPSDMAFIATAAKRQRSEVKLTNLTAAEKEEFRVAKDNEVKNWLKTGTISRILRNQVPHDQILRCRWILTWKPIDAEDQKKLQSNKSCKAKARLVILGYLDPNIAELPRDAPTLGRNSKMLLLQTIASCGWTLRSFDIKAAFLQGKPQPGRTLAVEPVAEFVEALQLKTNEILKLEKGAYGLVDAPYLWYQAILEELLNLGFQQSPFCPCTFILRNPKTQMPDGVIGLHVDDGICGGNQRFLDVLDQLEKKYPFGSKKISNFTFTGIDMTQQANGTITMSQSKYVRAINPIKIPHSRRSKPEEKVTEEERQELRALIGSLQYASVHTRPDLASRLSNLQSAINQATIETLCFANQTLHEAKTYHDVEIQIQPINMTDIRFLAFSDASFASKSNPNSHTGSIIMTTHKDIQHNTTCPVSPIAWGCKKIQRVVTSTLAAEATSLSTVLDQLSWLRLYWAWIINPNTNWKSPKNTLQQLPTTYSTATYKAQQLPESVAATDCKSLFDLVTKTAVPSCSEFRTQLTARSIKDLLDENVSLRWVHSGAQLADSLTKVMKNEFLRATLKLGKYRLNDELEVLKQRASARNRLQWLKSTCPDTECHLCCDDCFLTESW